MVAVGNSTPQITISEICPQQREDKLSINYYQNLGKERKLSLLEKQNSKNTFDHESVTENSSQTDVGQISIDIFSQSTEKAQSDSLVTFATDISTKDVLSEDIPSSSQKEANAVLMIEDALNSPENATQIQSTDPEIELEQCFLQNDVHSINHVLNFPHDQFSEVKHNYSSESVLKSDRSASGDHSIKSPKKTSNVSEPFLQSETNEKGLSEKTILGKRENSSVFQGKLPQKNCIELANNLEQQKDIKICSILKKTFLTNEIVVPDIHTKEGIPFSNYTVDRKISTRKVECKMNCKDGKSTQIQIIHEIHPSTGKSEGEDINDSISSSFNFIPEKHYEDKLKQNKNIIKFRNYSKLTEADDTKVNEEFLNCEQGKNISIQHDNEQRIPIDEHLIDENILNTQRMYSGADTSSQEFIHKEGLVHQYSGSNIDNRPITPPGYQRETPRSRGSSEHRRIRSATGVEELRIKSPRRGERRPPKREESYETKCCGLKKVKKEKSEPETYTYDFEFTPSIESVHAPAFANEENEQLPTSKEQEPISNEEGCYCHPGASGGGRTEFVPTILENRFDASPNDLCEPHQNNAYHTSQQVQQCNEQQNSHQEQFCIPAVYPYCVPCQYPFPLCDPNLLPCDPYLLPCDPSSHSCDPCFHPYDSYLQPCDLPPLLMPPEELVRLSQTECDYYSCYPLDQPQYTACYRVKTKQMHQSSEEDSAESESDEEGEEEVEDWNEESVFADSEIYENGNGGNGNSDEEQISAIDLSIKPKKRKTNFTRLSPIGNTGDESPHELTASDSDTFTLDPLTAEVERPRSKSPTSPSPSVHSAPSVASSSKSKRSSNKSPSVTLSNKLKPIPFDEAEYSEVTSEESDFKDSGDDIVSPSDELDSENLMQEKKLSSGFTSVKSPSLFLSTQGRSVSGSEVRKLDKEGSQRTKKRHESSQGTKKKASKKKTTQETSSDGLLELDTICFKHPGYNPGSNLLMNDCCWPLQDPYICQPPCLPQSICLPQQIYTKQEPKMQQSNNQSVSQGSSVEASDKFMKSPQYQLNSVNSSFNSQLQQNVTMPNDNHQEMPGSSQQSGQPITAAQTQCIPTICFPRCSYCPQSTCCPSPRLQNFCDSPSDLPGSSLYPKMASQHFYCDPRSPSPYPLFQPICFPPPICIPICPEPCAPPPPPPLPPKPVMHCVGTQTDPPPPSPPPQHIYIPVCLPPPRPICIPTPVFHPICPCPPIPSQLPSKPTSIQTDTEVPLCRISPVCHPICVPVCPPIKPPDCSPVPPPPPPPEITDCATQTEPEVLPYPSPQPVCMPPRICIPQPVCLPSFFSQYHPTSSPTINLVSAATCRERNIGDQISQLNSSPKQMSFGATACAPFCTWQPVYLPSRTQDNILSNKPDCRESDIKKDVVRNCSVNRFHKQGEGTHFNSRPSFDDRNKTIYYEPQQELRYPGTHLRDNSENMNFLQNGSRGNRYFHPYSNVNSYVPLYILPSPSSPGNVPSPELCSQTNNVPRCLPTDESRNRIVASQFAQMQNNTFQNNALQNKRPILPPCGAVKSLETIHRRGSYFVPLSSEMTWRDGLILQNHFASTSGTNGLGQAKPWYTSHPNNTI